MLVNLNQWFSLWMFIKAEYS